MATTARTLAPPRAAAVAGMLFSVLMGTSLVITRLVVPPYQSDPGEWVTDPAKRSAVRFAIQLAPFAGIAFLWFIGVFRSRLGALEDRFFATVFLGSGLLFVASLFASAVIAGALVEAMARDHARLMDSDTYYLARHIVGTAMNVFAIKMAGVFIISTSTLVLRTAILPRWVAFMGFGCAAVLLTVITSWPWITLLFPLWMFIISTRILMAEFRTGERTIPTQIEAQ